jgi:hypothetical protein
MQLNLIPDQTRDVGKSNALFLGDLANGMTASELRTNWKAGKYPGLNEQLARDNLAFWGRK